GRGRWGGRWRWRWRWRWWWWRRGVGVLAGPRVAVPVALSVLATRVRIPPRRRFRGAGGCGHDLSRHPPAPAGEGRWSHRRRDHVREALPCVTPVMSTCTGPVRTADTVHLETLGQYLVAQEIRFGINRGTGLPEQV